MDNTETGKDRAQAQAGQNLQLGTERTSATEQLPSKIEVNKQYSGAEVLDFLSADGRVQKDRADKAEAEVGRLGGVANDLTTQLNTVSGQVSQLVKAQDEAEVAKVGEDPVAINSVRARQANRAETLRLEGVAATQQARDTAFAAREATVKQAETSSNIKLAALESGVDEKSLIDLVPDGDPERLKKAVNIIKQTGTIDRTTGKLVPPGLEWKPASTFSAGGRQTGDSPDDKITEGLKRLK